MAVTVPRKPPLPVAATGTTTVNREVVGDEYVSALRDIQARMRVYTRMRRGDGAVNTSLLAVEKPILGARWDLDGDDEIAEACRAEFFDSDHAEPHDASIFEQALAKLVEMFQYGFAAAEPQWGIGTDGRVHCEALTLIRQESVRGFRLTERGRLETLIQYTQGADGMIGDIHVPAAGLLLAVHQRDGADYSGVALIRSSYRAFLERDTIRKTRLWHHDRFGAGTPVAVYREGASDAEKSEVDAALEGFRSGTQTYLAVPAGTQLQIIGGQVSGDPTPELAALAAEIAKNTLSQLTELGTSGNSGNRALGGSFAEMLRTALQGNAEYLAKVIRRQLITPWVRWNFGEAARVPNLTVRVSLAGVAELLTAVTMATGAGLHLEPEDIAALRDELELPEIPLEELTQRIEARRVVAPAPGAPTAPGAPSSSRSRDDDGIVGEGTEDERPATLAEKSGRGLYISRPVANVERLARWFAEQPALAGRTLDRDLHCTQMYSTTPVPDVEPSFWTVSAKVTSTGVLGDDRAFVLFLDAPDLHERYGELLAAGATPTYPSYRPHVTLFYLGPDEAPPADVTLPGFDIVLGEERFAPIQLAEDDGTTAELAPDWLGRPRLARVVALESAFLRPRLLAEQLDRETVRAAADVHDVLREIDRALVEQVRSLAARGGEALVRGAAEIEAPKALVTRLQRAVTTAARRAQAIGAEAVRDEMARQGVAPSPPARSLMERLRAPLRRLLADEESFGGLATMLAAMLALYTKREIAQRVTAAQQAALAAVAAEAAAVASAAGAAARALNPQAIAQRVADALGERSRAAVEARVGEVVNVSFGQGRREASRGYANEIERQIRSEALDANTCDHCREHDGDDFAYGDPRAPELPDPECDGGYRCRGVWMYVLRRRAA